MRTASSPSRSSSISTLSRRAGRLLPWTHDQHGLGRLLATSVLLCCRVFTCIWLSRRTIGVPLIPGSWWETMVLTIISMVLTIISITYREKKRTRVHTNMYTTPTPHTQVLSLTLKSALVDFTTLYLLPRLLPQSDFIQGYGPSSRSSSAYFL